MTHCRLKEIRDQLEQQGCPVDQSLKVARIIADSERRSASARVASAILISNWRNIVGSEGL